MTIQNDPVSQIKKVEEDAEQKIQNAKKRLEDDLREFSTELTKKTGKFENSLKEKGLEKLENVKKEAGELYKSKMAAAESGKNKIIAEAKGRQEEAVKEVINKFLESVKMS